jgi:hypothetical protein
MKSFTILILATLLVVVSVWFADYYQQKQQHQQQQIFKIQIEQRKIDLRVKGLEIKLDNFHILPA